MVEILILEMFINTSMYIAISFCSSILIYYYIWNAYCVFEHI